jgi:PleD family two-component response regulator
LAERIRARVAGMKWPGVDGAITASLSVASYSLHASSILSFIKSADSALYRAKELGRNMNMVCMA